MDQPYEISNPILYDSSDYRPFVDFNADVFDSTEFIQYRGHHLHIQTNQVEAYWPVGSEFSYFQFSIHRFEDKGNQLLFNAWLFTYVANQTYTCE